MVHFKIKIMYSTSDVPLNARGTLWEYHGPGMIAEQPLCLLVCVKPHLYYI